jgi:hypothetical protein
MRRKNRPARPPKVDRTPREIAMRTHASTSPRRPRHSPARWILLALLLLFAAVTASKAHAQESLDQANDPVAWGGAAVHITAQATQTVAPALACLTRVDVALMTGNRGKGGDTVTLTVIDWNPYPPKVLATVSQPVQEGFDGWLRFDLATPVTVPNAWLALRIQDTGKTVFWWKYQNGNPYPGGNWFLAGSGDGRRDFLFRTYGRETCRGFALKVTDPVTLAQGASSPASVSVTRMGGFTGTVNVTLALPGNVTASPGLLAIAGTSATATLYATATATAGSFNATANGTATGVPSAQRAFHVNVTALAGPRLSAVTPTVQQHGGTITLSGSGFDASCGMNTISLGAIQLAPATCSAGTLTAKIPAQAAYGVTTVQVSARGQASNKLPFSVGRETGAFTEITAGVVGQHAARTCTAGTAKVEIAPTTGSGWQAQYRRVAGNAPIGSAIAFDADFWYMSGSTRIIRSGIGGAGFSLCGTGVVFDAGGTSPRLVLRDLDSGTSFQASPYAIAIRVPRLQAPASEDYTPRFFRSPDGTLLLAVTAAPSSGTGQILATFFDKVAAGKVLDSVAITKPAGSAYVGNPAISASVEAGNHVKLVFGTQVFTGIGVP